MKTKLILILCILSILLTCLCGCYDAHSIENLAYATAIGLDVSEDNILSLTLQFSIPSSSSDSGSSQSSKADSITVQCTSINSGISLINNHISNEVNLSHCKVIVISEELAEQGLADYVDTLANNIEIRPDCSVVISRGSAKHFIESAPPSVENLIVRYYQVALNSTEYTGYTPSITLTDFISYIKNSFIQGHAILGGVNTGNNSTSENGTYSGLDSDYKAGETPISSSDSTVETFGTAVFYDDKLIGELNGIETVCHLLVTNDLTSCTISIPDPFNINSSIDLHITKKKDCKVFVEFINGSPYISIDVFIDAFGLSLDEETNYQSLEDIHILTAYAEQYIKLQVNNYLYKTSKELNSDISGSGKYALSKYLTWDEWLESNWLENYKNSFFDVNVTVRLKSGYEFNKSP